MFFSKNQALLWCLCLTSLVSAGKYDNLHQYYYPHKKAFSPKELAEELGLKEYTIIQSPVKNKHPEGSNAAPSAEVSDHTSINGTAIYETKHDANCVKGKHFKVKGCVAFDDGQSTYFKPFDRSVRFETPFKKSQAQIDVLHQAALKGAAKAFRRDVKEEYFFGTEDEVLADIQERALAKDLTLSPNDYKEVDNAGRKEFWTTFDMDNTKNLKKKIEDPFKAVAIYQENDEKNGYMGSLFLLKRASNECRNPDYLTDEALYNMVKSDHSIENPPMGISIIDGMTTFTAMLDDGSLLEFKPLSVSQIEKQCWSCAMEESMAKQSGGKKAVDFSLHRGERAKIELGQKKKTPPASMAEKKAQTETLRKTISTKNSAIVRFEKSIMTSRKLIDKEKNTLEHLNTDQNMPKNSKITAKNKRLIAQSEGNISKQKVLISGLEHKIQNLKDAIRDIHQDIAVVNRGNTRKG